MWMAVVVLGVLVRLGVAVEPPWWSNAVYYRILVDSFRDADGDGLGDINGATKQISYVRAIGADAVILSTISSRNTDCAKPGVIDFSEIDQRYGDSQSFSSLLEKLKKLELKMVLTLPLQTVSAASEWFISSADKASGFEDRILWREGNSDEPPPARLSAAYRLHYPHFVCALTLLKSENGITWIFNDARNAFYASSGTEPLLNLCSETVSAALSAAQCVWLRRGVSGVLLNPDFPPDEGCGEKLLKKLAADAMACARSASLDTPVILVESSLPPEAAARYYGDGGVGANSVLSTALASPSRSSAAGMGIAFQSALLTTPEDGTPTWITSSTNFSRIATRCGSEMVDSINLLSMILPGAVIIQQGDELGSADTILEWATSTTCWPNPASPSAAPMSWDDTANAGFSAGNPWLPVSPNYRYANAKEEYANDMSHQGVVRLTAAMRKSPAIGPHVEIKRLGGAIAVLRWGGPGSLLVISNLAREQTEVQLSQIAGLPKEITVAISSAGSSLSTGSHVAVDKTLKLAPGETLLLAGGPRHCGGPGPVDKIANKLSEGWQKLNKYFNNM